MKLRIRLTAGAVWLLAAVASVSALAAPVWLECRASGAAGTVAFRFGFDEAANQAAIAWSAGGGRPNAPYFGETGVENAVNVGFTLAYITASHQTAAYDDPYAYRVNIGRTDGSLAFIRYSPGGHRISNGSCSPAAGPNRIF